MSNVPPSITGGHDSAPEQPEWHYVGHIEVDGTFLHSADIVVRPEDTQKLQEAIATLLPQPWAEGMTQTDVDVDPVSGRLRIGTHVTECRLTEESLEGIRQYVADHKQPVDETLAGKRQETGGAATDILHEAEATPSPGSEAAETGRIVVRLPMTLEVQKLNADGLREGDVTSRAYGFDEIEATMNVEVNADDSHRVFVNGADTGFGVTDECMEAILDPDRVPPDRSPAEPDATAEAASPAAENPDASWQSVQPGSRRRAGRRGTRLRGRTALQRYRAITGGKISRPLAKAGNSTLLGVGSYAATNAVVGETLAMNIAYNTTAGSAIGNSIPVVGPVAILGYRRGLGVLAACGVGNPEFRQMERALDGIFGNDQAAKNKFLEQFYRDLWKTDDGLINTNAEVKLLQAFHKSQLMHPLRTPHMPGALGGSRRYVRYAFARMAGLCHMCEHEGDTETAIRLIMAGLPENMRNDATLHDELKEDLEHAYKLLSKEEREFLADRNVIDPTATKVEIADGACDQILSAAGFTGEQVNDILSRASKVDAKTKRRMINREKFNREVCAILQAKNVPDTFAAHQIESLWRSITTTAMQDAAWKEDHNTDLRELREASIAYGRMVNNTHVDRFENGITASTVGSTLPVVAAGGPLWALPAAGVLLGRHITRVINRGGKLLGFIPMRGRCTLELDPADPTKPLRGPNNSVPIAPEVLEARGAFAQGGYIAEAEAGNLTASEASIGKDGMHWYRIIKQNMEQALPDGFRKRTFGDAQELANFCAAYMHSVLASSPGLEKERKKDDQHLKHKEITDLETSCTDLRGKIDARKKVIKGPLDEELTRLRTYETNINGLIATTNAAIAKAKKPEAIAELKVALNEYVQQLQQCRTDQADIRGQLKTKETDIANDPTVKRLEKQLHEVEHELNELMEHDDHESHTAPGMAARKNAQADDLLKDQAAKKAFAVAVVEEWNGGIKNNRGMWSKAGSVLAAAGMSPAVQQAAVSAGKVAVMGGLTGGAILLIAGTGPVALTIAGIVGGWVAVKTALAQIGVNVVKAVTSAPKAAVAPAAPADAGHGPGGH